MLLMLIALLAAVLVKPNSLESVEEKAALTIRTTQLLTHFIHNYKKRFGQWPDQTNDCADAYKKLADVGASHWRDTTAMNAWNRPLKIFCKADEEKLEIVQEVTDQAMGSYISNALAFSKLKDNDDDTTKDQFPVLVKVTMDNTQPKSILTIERRYFSKWKKNRTLVTFAPGSSGWGGAGNKSFTCPQGASYTHTVWFPSMCAKDAYSTVNASTGEEESREDFTVYQFAAIPADKNSIYEYNLKVQTDFLKPGSGSNNWRAMDDRCGGYKSYADFIISCEPD